MGGFLLIFLVLFPMAGAVAGYLTGRKNKSARDWLVLAVTVVELLGALLLLYFPGATLRLDGICGLGLTFQADGFRMVMALLTAAVWMMTTLPSRSYFAHARNRNRYYLFLLLALGATMGIFLSGDLYTTFIFFEMMSFASYVWVVQEETPEAISASRSYLTIGVLGGLVTLMGVFLLYHLAGTLQLDALRDACAAVENRRLLYAAGGCILFGFAAKAGMFPLHAWLPAAHPVAPSPASAALSGIIVKSGVLAVIRVVFYIAGPDLLRGTWVQNIWMTLTLLTVFMGSLLAFREPVFKKRLAYSTVSQVSYILFGLSVLQPEAMSGALMHVIFHAFIKCALFLTAGVFIFKYGKTRVEELDGIGKQLPKTLWCYTFAALALIGIPPTSGFISKWHLAEGALAAPVGVFRYLGPIVLLVSALLTAGYLLPVTVHGFLPGRDWQAVHSAQADPEKEPVGMLVPLLVLAALAVLLGLFPNPVISYVTDLAATLL
mgnify:CR=1 FL=1